MKAVIWIVPFVTMLITGCATRTRSLTLGGAGGVAIGVASGASMNSGSSGPHQTRNALVGAGIGLGVGLLASYLLHDHVDDRLKFERYENDERLRFGDLPPNPFSPSNYRFSEQK